jgi:hypothetical protein
MTARHPQRATTMELWRDADGVIDRMGIKNVWMTGHPSLPFKPHQA